MSMSSIVNKVLEKVKKEHIAKIPRWRFAVKRGLIWLTLGVAVVLGAFAISMVIFQIMATDWDLVPLLKPNPHLFFLQFLPNFWLLVATLLFIFVYFDFRTTRRGYRYSGPVVIGMALVATSLLGSGMYFLNGPAQAEEIFYQYPAYQHMHPNHGMVWNAPERGLLSGMVVEVRDDDNMVLEDVVKKIWVVRINGAVVHVGPMPRKTSPSQFKDEQDGQSEEDLPVGSGQQRVVIMRGDRVKVIGVPTDETGFSAREIRIIWPRAR